MTELIALTLTTAAVNGSAPQSLLVVGPPGSGKSALLERFAEPNDSSFNPTARLMGNLSAWGLRSFLQLEAPRGVTHVIAPEMQTLFMRRADTWASVEGILLQAMAEGVGDYYNGPIPESYGKAKMGLIAAMTRDAYLRVRADFARSGLSSRFLVVRWNPTHQQILAALHRSAAGKSKDLAKFPLNLPRIRVNIDVPLRVRMLVLRYVEERFTNEMNRALGRFIALTQAAALRRGVRSATSSDWKAVLEGERFWTGEV
jgi:hypothetical protein